MKNEKLGIRCGLLSQRHRLWGECPMVDLDHVVSLPALEYDNQKAVALVEYKFGLGAVNLKSANIAAMEDLAQRASLPFFVASYDPTDWEFCVRPRNDQARAHVPTKQWMGERGFVGLLHQLRGRTAPPSLLATLSPDPDDSGAAEVTGTSADTSAVSSESGEEPSSPPASLE